MSTPPPAHPFHAIYTISNNGHSTKPPEGRFKECRRPTTRPTSRVRVPFSEGRGIRLPPNPCQHMMRVPSNASAKPYKILKIIAKL